MLPSILITNTVLRSYSGTEVVVRDLATGLAQRGHRVGVYSPNPGALADEIRSAGIPVVDDPGKLPFAPDIIHGHHHVETLLAIESFPGAMGIFVCHDRTAWTDLTPYHPRLLRYVAVDLNCRERLEVEGRIPGNDITVISNAVDLRRFAPRKALPEVPQRALVFSNYAHAVTHLNPILEACAQVSLPVDVAGERAGKLVTAPEKLLPEYDLVFAKARCACEAMATGCAVILCDFAGLGSLVTRDAVAIFREWNFGRRLLKRPIRAELIVQEIHRYNASDAAQVSGWIRQNAGLDAALDCYERLYEEVLQTRPSHDLSRYQEILTAGLRRISLLETQMASDKSTPEMAPISAEIANDISLSVEESGMPVSLSAGASFSLDVTITNRSAVVLHSTGCTPLLLSYHWLRGSDGSMHLLEGVRNGWTPGIEAGESRAVRLCGNAPKEPGEYLLQITFVQEHLCWLENLADTLPWTARVQVVSEPAFGLDPQLSPDFLG